MKNVFKLLCPIVFTGILATAGPAAAQDDIPPGFEPIKGKERAAEQVDASKLVVGAYGSIFVLTFGFILYIARKQSEISEEIRALSERFENKQ